MLASYNNQIIERQLAVETTMPLCNDILVIWGTTYSHDHFETCKVFDGPVDKECNCQIPSTKFNQVLLIQNLVDTFMIMFPYPLLTWSGQLSSLNQVVDFRHGTGTST